MSLRKNGGSTFLARMMFPTASMAYDLATGKNIKVKIGRNYLAVLNRVKKRRIINLPTQTTHKQY